MFGTHSKKETSSLVESDILHTQLALVEDVIQTKSMVVGVPLIKDIVKHIIGAGGKRIRPILSLTVAGMFGTINEAVRISAAAIEFIHTATLLHDDVVDLGEKRRGKSAANIIWGNQSAILVGDHLFARAFSLLTHFGSLDALRIVASASEQLAQGEILQLSLKNHIPTQEQYLQIISTKTASLFSASCEVGAILVGASPTECQKMRDLGLYFGLTFQIIDDILDYESETTVTGKKQGSDFFEGKFTLPLILAYNKASHELQEKIVTLMSPLRERTQDDFEFILEFLKNSGTLQEARQIAFEFDKKNRAILEASPASPLRDSLEELCNKALYRQS